MEDRTMSRSLKIAAAASAAGAACLSLGLFLAIAKDSRAGEDVAVWTTDGDDDAVKKVKVISLSNDDEDGAEAETRGYLGVDVREETKSDEGGAYVNHVVEDSPAAKGGLKDGDVIVGFGGDVVRGPAKLTQKIHATKPGDKVALDVRRDGRVQKLTVEMGKRPDVWRMSWSGDSLAPLDENYARSLRESLKGLENLGPEIEKGVKGKMKIYAPRAGVRSFWFGGGKPILGVELVNTTEELREAMGARKDAGVLIGKVIEDSAAAKAGLKAGDLILSVDGTTVVDPGELGEEVREREGKTVDLEIIRDKRAMHVKVTLPEIQEEDTPQGPRAELFRLPAIAPLPPAPPLAPLPAVPPPAPVPAPALPRALATVFV